MFTERDELRRRRMRFYHQNCNNASAAPSNAIVTEDGQLIVDETTSQPIDQET